MFAECVQDAYCLHWGSPQAGEQLDMQHVVAGLCVVAAECVQDVCRMLTVQPGAVTHLVSSWTCSVLLLDCVQDAYCLHWGSPQASVQLDVWYFDSMLLLLLL
jgi:hypothetical protein